MPKRTLILECSEPGLIDYLSTPEHNGAIVKTTIEDGRLCITVEAFYGRDHSAFDIQRFTVELPEKDETDNDEEE